MTSDPKPANLTGQTGSPSPRLDELVGHVVENRGLFIRLPLIVAVGAVLVGMMLPPSFTSSASVVPQVDMSQLRGAGIAAQLGINLAGSDATQSPDFYVSLIRSSTFLGQLVDATYPVESIGGDTVRLSLIEVLRVTAPNRGIARLRTIALLRARVAASTDLKTGIVRLSATMPTQMLALQVVQQALRQLNEFNDENRQLRGTLESRFLAGRVGEVSVTVRRLESEMQRFLERNRTYENSAALRFEFERIDRELSLARQLLGQLSQQLDQATIERFRNTPLLTVVEPPALPARQDRRYLAYRGVIAVGATVALLLMGLVALQEGARYLETRPGIRRRLPILSRSAQSPL